MTSREPPDSSNGVSDGSGPLLALPYQRLLLENILTTDALVILARGLGLLTIVSHLLYHYDNPEIREIIISGDIAVVRPIWTLTTRKGGEQDVSTEAGIDIFKRQPDGRWSISRFASFTDKPNKNLQ